MKTHKIKTVAGGLPELLREYEVEVPSGLPQLPTPGQYSVRDAVTEILPMTFEHYRVEMSTHEQAAFENASGELMKPTPEAIANRIIKFEDNSCSDGVGNIYSFAYKMDSVFGDNWLAVCPEGKEEIITKLCGCPEAVKNQEYKSSSQSNPSSNAVSTLAATADKIQKQVIDIVFESFDEKRLITCTIDKKPPDQRPNLYKGALRFLAFNAGDIKGYFFAFRNRGPKGVEKVLLINDGQDKKKALRINDKQYQEKVSLKNNPPDVKVLTSLFDVINIIAATPLMFKPFLPPSYVQCLANGNDAHIQEINTEELTKLLFMRNEQYPKLDYNGDSLSIAELKEDIKFNIKLSKEFKAALKELPKYKKNNNIEYKTIIDFIIETFPEPPPISDRQAKGLSPVALPIAGSF